MRRRYAQMRGYAPYFDGNVFGAWTPPPTSFYKDLYAIYNPEESQLIQQHPDWVLRDAEGDPLFIPSDCGGGSCRQWAADVGNPGWRSHWIQEAAAVFATADRRSPSNPGYTGIFIDDVNLEFQVSNGAADHRRPIDPRTGQPMTRSDWQRYVVEFLERIRAAFPGKQITHNSLWWMSHGNPMVRRQVGSADVIQLERGFNDRGLTPHRGRFSYRRFLRHIDWLHRRGKSIVLEPYLSNKRQARYELANYFLVRKGDDAIATDFRADPPSGGPGGKWWSSWGANLGPARGRRHRWHGLWRRNFRKGIAIVNPRGERSRRLKLSATLAARGAAKTAGPRHVRLRPGEGVLLRKR
jgi:hypothetical protein